jgi:hypothetical protein
MRKINNRICCWKRLIAPSGVAQGSFKMLIVCLYDVTKWTFYRYIGVFYGYYGWFCMYASLTYIVQFQNGACVMSGQITFLSISLNFHRIVLCFSCCVVLWTYSLRINVLLLVVGATATKDRTRLNEGYSITKTVESFYKLV